MPKLKESEYQLRDKRIREIIVGKLAYHGYRPEKFAKMCGMSTKTFYRRKNNPSEISISEARTMAKVLKLSDEEISEFY